MGRKKHVDIYEDWCFVCKDGGNLLLCQHKDCIKSYHPKCVGKDESILNSKESWQCDWHLCFFCKKAAKLRCFCCPYAICGKCLPDAGFIVVQGIKGFCGNCLKFAKLWEEKRNEDSDGGKTDFTERGTWEFLFMDYWEIIKENEGLTLEILQSASASLKKGGNKMEDEVDEIDSTGQNLLYDDCEWNAMEDYVPSRIGRKRKVNAFKDGGNCKVGLKKRRSNRKEFLEWGSKSLIEFLGSLGVDTGVTLSYFDVIGIIIKYIDDENLLHPHCKEMIVCDQRLSSLLGRKLVNKHRLYSFVQEHYGTEKEESQTKERLILRRCMASIVVENIKLVFLRRSVVEDLLKKPEFEGEMIGSFVMVKPSPFDSMQPYSHQLVQVTGMKKLSTNGAKDETLFHVSSIPVDISVDMLSESDFTKEECDQLNQKIKDGVHKKLTVGYMASHSKTAGVYFEVLQIRGGIVDLVELEEKARQLHGEITKHWFKKELALLKNRIDEANETGQRRELMEYTERRNLLLSPREQLRLMMEIPEVIADEIIDLSSDDEVGNEGTKLKSMNETARERESGKLYIMALTGEVRGPFQLFVLQKWNELSGNSAYKFKVWREGQSPETALPLPEVCR